MTMQYGRNEQGSEFGYFAKTVRIPSRTKRKEADVKKANIGNPGGCLRCKRNGE